MLADSAVVCSEYFELFTFEHCNRGDELMISYGAEKCNFELMRDYGFVLEGSPLSCDRIHFVYECQRLLRDRGADVFSAPCASTSACNVQCKERLSLVLVSVA